MTPGVSHMERTRMFVVPFRGLKRGLVPLKVFSLKCPQQELLQHLLVVLSQKKKFDRNWYLLGVKNISSHTHKTGSWYL